MNASSIADELAKLDPRERNQKLREVLNVPVHLAASVPTDHDAVRRALSLNALLVTELRRRSLYPAD